MEALDGASMKARCRVVGAYEGAVVIDPAKLYSMYNVAHIYQMESHWTVKYQAVCLTARHASGQTS